MFSFIRDNYNDFISFKSKWINPMIASYLLLRLPIDQSVVMTVFQLYKWLLSIICIIFIYICKYIYIKLAIFMMLCKLLRWNCRSNELYQLNHTEVPQWGREQSLKFSNCGHFDNMHQYWPKISWVTGNVPQNDHLNCQCEVQLVPLIG